jgi:hypothetical protein
LHLIFEEVEMPFCRSALFYIFHEKKNKAFETDKPRKKTLRVTTSGGNKKSQPKKYP